MSTSEKNPRYVTTTSGMSGHFAVLVWWNPDLGGFYEPWVTGDGRYATKEEAEAEGKVLATAEGVEFRYAQKATVHQLQTDTTI